MKKKSKKEVKKRHTRIIIFLLVATVVFITKKNMKKKKRKVYLGPKTTPDASFGPVLSSLVVVGINAEGGSGIVCRYSK